MNIKSLAQLRALLISMERSLGLGHLSMNEKDVLYAMSEVADGDPRTARSEHIRAHPLAAPIPQASYHRALAGLLDYGLISHAPEAKTGIYIVPGI
ncbi:MAG: hypothetical protein WCC57_09155 [Paracoccaceae bacterium]